MSNQRGKIPAKYGAAGRRMGSGLFCRPARDKIAGTKPPRAALAGVRNFPCPRMMRAPGGNTEEVPDMTIEIRPSLPQEEGGLRALWRTVFGDEEDYIDWFYRCGCCAPEDALVVAEDGVPVTMLYLLPMTLVSSAGARTEARYVYALATHPARRELGYGRRLLRYADRVMEERGLHCLTVVPAQPSLHRFFGSTGFRPCFSCRTACYTAGELGDPRPGDTLTAAGAAAYNRARDALLAGENRVCYSEAMIRFQEGGSRMSGGALCLLELGGRPACAAVELSGGTAVCKELLTAPGDEFRGAALIRARFGTPDCQVRTLPGRAGLPGSGVQAFGMIKWYPGPKACPWPEDTTGYLGLGFD